MIREILSASLTTLAAEISGIAKEGRRLSVAAGAFEGEINSIDGDDASDAQRRLVDHMRSEGVSRPEAPEPLGRSFSSRRKFAKSWKCLLRKVWISVPSPGFLNIDKIVPLDFVL